MARRRHHGKDDGHHDKDDEHYDMDEWMMNFIIRMRKDADISMNMIMQDQDSMKSGHRDDTEDTGKMIMIINMNYRMTA